MNAFTHIEHRDVLMHMFSFLERYDSFKCMMTYKMWYSILDKTIEPTQDDIEWACKHNKVESLKKILSYDVLASLNMKKALTRAHLRRNYECVNIIREYNGDPHMLNCVQKFGAKYLTNQSVFSYMENAIECGDDDFQILPTSEKIKILCGVLWNVFILNKILHFGMKIKKPETVTSSQERI